MTVKDAPFVSISTLEGDSELVSPSFGSPGQKFTFLPSTSSTPLLVTVPACNLHSAFAHRLWRAGMALADLIASKEVNVEGRNVLELGAGVGLPGIFAALSGAAFTALTDFDDEPLISGLRSNVFANLPEELRRNVIVAGQNWGTSIDDLLDHRGSFDDILCADVLWDTFSHDILIATILQTLSPTASARVHIVSGFHTGRSVIERALDRFAYRGLIIDEAFPPTELHVADGRIEPWSAGKEDGPVQQRNRLLLRVRLKWSEEALAC